MRKNDRILHMRVPDELRADLDDLRRAEPDLPTRSEMVRRLIERAIAELQGPLGPKQSPTRPKKR